MDRTYIIPLFDKVVGCRPLPTVSSNVDTELLIRNLIFCVFLNFFLTWFGHKCDIFLLLVSEFRGSFSFAVRRCFSLNYLLLLLFLSLPLQQPSCSAVAGGGQCHGLPHCKERTRRTGGNRHLHW
jgi:hypothetical protein